jgi:hypothetical protein
MLAHPHATREDLVECGRQRISVAHHLQAQPLNPFFVSSWQEPDEQVPAEQFNPARLVQSLSAAIFSHLRSVGSSVTPVSIMRFLKSVKSASEVL